MANTCIKPYSSPQPMPDFKPQGSFTQANVNTMKVCLGQGYLDTPLGGKTYKEWSEDVYEKWNTAMGFKKDKDGIKSYSVCPTIFNNWINNTGAITGFNRDNFELLQKGFEWSFSRVYSPGNGKLPNDPGVSTKYTVLQEPLFDYCTMSRPDLRGVCDLVSQKMCSGCQRTQLDGRAQFRICGCNVPMDKIALDNGVTPNCDPICSIGDVFKKRDLSNGNVITCDKSVCVINDVSVQAASSILQNISFIQMCPYCSVGGSGTNNQTQIGTGFVQSPFAGAVEGLQVTGAKVAVNGEDPKDDNKESGCICIIDASIPGIGQRLGIDNPETFKQYCGKNSVCIQVNNITGEQKSVECADSLSDVKPNSYNNPVPIWTWVIAFSIVIIGVIMLLAAYTDSRKDNVYRPTLYRADPDDYKKGMTSKDFQ